MKYLKIFLYQKKVFLTSKMGKKNIPSAWKFYDSRFLASD